MPRFAFQAKGSFYNDFIVEADDEAHAVQRARALAAFDKLTLSAEPPRKLLEGELARTAHFKDGFFKATKIGAR